MVEQEILAGDKKESEHDERLIVLPFLKSLEKMGKKIDEAQKEFNALTSTRRNQLERPLRQIEDLRRQKGILPELSLNEGETVDVEEIQDVEN